MNVVAENLLFFLEGGCAGWIFARAFAWAELSALRQESPVPATPSRRRRLIVIDVVAVALAVLGIAVIINGGVPDAQSMWNFSREANKILGPLVVAGIVWRLLPMVLDPARWRDSRAAHVLAWYLYISVSIANATFAAYVTDGTPTYPSAIRMILNVVAIALCAWWPHPRKYVPLERPEVSV